MDFSNIAGDASPSLEKVCGRCYLRPLHPATDRVPIHYSESKMACVNNDMIIIWRTTLRHLLYGITQCYLPPDTSERAPP